MRIFLTGGSGFVGGAVLKALSVRHEIRALSRTPRSDHAIAKLGGEPVRGDIRMVGPDIVGAADAVIHCAAHVGDHGAPHLFESVNVNGTKRMLEAAKAAQARRFVHVGTEAALFSGQAMRDIDESAPLAFDSPFPYARSKARAEAAVVAADDSAAGFETIVVRPRMVWGEGDQTILPALKARAAAGRFAWIDGGAAMTSTTHVDNLVHALECALTRGAGAEAYFVTDGAPMRVCDFLSRYGAACGVDLGDRSIPGWLARGVADVLEPVWSLLKILEPPPVTRFSAYLMSRDCTISDAKARAELGYAPVVTVEEGLARLANAR